MCTSQSDELLQTQYTTAAQTFVLKLHVKKLKPNFTKSIKFYQYSPLNISAPQPRLGVVMGATNVHELVMGL